MGKAFFVSGIDTGIGKTVVTGLLARSLLRRGVKTITVKMVQTGCDGFSEDRDAHRAMMALEGAPASFPEDREGLTAPQIFGYPASAQLAARLEGRTVDVERIVSCVRDVASRYDATLVEGAGGLAVPLDDMTFAVDVAARERWPLILVTSGRLGSINHTMLSLEAALSRGMEILGVVFNWSTEEDSVIADDAAGFVSRWLFRRRIEAPVVRIGRVAGGEFPSALDEISSVIEREIW